MSLPNLPAGDKFRREVRTEWGGINSNENAGGGELIEAMNMSSREYPLLATRREWYLSPINSTQRPTITDSAALGVSKRLFWVSKDSGVWKFFYDYAAKGTLSALTREAAAKIRFAQMQDKIYIFPDKKIYDETAGTFKSMESTFDSGASTVVFKNGTIGGVPADGNTIYCSGVDWASYFSVGDAVSISGSGVPENNKTAIIREIDGDELHFDENCFSDVDAYWHLYTYESMPSGSSYYFYTSSSTWLGFTLVSTVPAGVMLELHGANLQYLSPPPHPQVVLVATTYTGGTPSGTEITMLPPANSDHVTIARTIPDMDFVCVNENRMWGCKGDTIYCSKQGDPYNWNVFDGLSTDSWTAETGTPEEFTGCVSYQSYPVFFKANAVFRVMGDNPSQYSIRKMDIPGVSAGSDLSIAVVESTLYYLADKGVCAWNGSADPTVISTALGIDRRWVSGRAGSDGKRYYLSAFEMTEKPPDFSGAKWMYLDKDLCYDTRFGTWHELRISVITGAFDSDRPVGYSRYARQVDKLYFLDSESNNLLMLEGIPDASSVGGYGTRWGAEPTYAESHDWRVTFADSTRAYKTALTGSESKKGVLRLLIRCKVSGIGPPNLPAFMKVWIAYDGGEFEEAAEIEETAKTSKVVPLILRRCDFWQLRLTGTGDAVIYSIAVEKYGGEWQQT